jgi:hypothetical protein
MIFGPAVLRSTKAGEAELMKVKLDRDEHGRLIRKAGVVGVVVTGGPVQLS